MNEWEMNEMMKEYTKTKKEWINERSMKEWKDRWKMNERTRWKDK